MQFPATVLKLVPGSLIVTPERRWRAITFGSAAAPGSPALTPIRFDWAPSAIQTPLLPFPSAFAPVDVDADQVAGDDVEVGPGPADVHPLIGVAGDDVSLGGVAIAVAVGADHVRLGAVLDVDPDAAVAEWRPAR